MPRRTLAREIEIEGVALHAGTRVHMRLAPAMPGSGVAFRRNDLGGAIISARYDQVGQTRLGTVIENGNGASVGVIEHLMAAVAGCEIDDLDVILDGPEPPILDGDALSYLSLLSQAGVVDTAGSREAIKVKRPVSREAIKVKRPVSVGTKEARAALFPSETREFRFEIDFPSAAIGHQALKWRFSREGFAADIAPARTFGFVHEIEALNKSGLGRGASLENTLAIEGDKVINSSLMRFPDEFVRHKILDAIGDLALAGAPILGRFEGHRSGHGLNNQLLRALFSDPDNYNRVSLD
ncbi:MAG: UDP-3-O-[3-hydroxymyristoyl] N-acetylglucosamine deacetylase [Alphaproteobacteria bacterium]|nr:UDP-3-O-[3-hydroxymyristoyl] N-acetylglucosamine deacetylase [Alphaproteobacteria bacterium]